MADCVVLADPDDAVPSSGEAESTVVPGACEDTEEGPPVGEPETCVSSQLSEAALTPVELGALPVEVGLGTVTTVVTDPPSSTSEGTGPAVPVAELSLHWPLSQTVDTGGISVPIGELVEPALVPLSGEALLTPLKVVEPAEVLGEDDPSDTGVPVTGDWLWMVVRLASQPRGPHPVRVEPPEAVAAESVSPGCDVRQASGVTVT